MRGINGEKLGLKYLNVGKIVLISSLCRVKCKLYLRIKTHGERDYKKCHWTKHFGYVVCKMMTIFVTRRSCVEVDPFVGNWSKRRQTETPTTKTSTNRNVDTPKRRQTKASTNQNVDRPKCGQDNSVHCIIVYLFSWFLGCTLYIRTYVWLVGCTLYKYPLLYNYRGLLYISVPVVVVILFPTEYNNTIQYTWLTWPTAEWS